MIIGLLKESGDERRVGLLPESVATLTKMKVTVIVEKSAGEKAFASDDDYIQAGGVIDTKENVLAKADLLIKVNAPDGDDVAKMSEGKVLVSVLNAFTNKPLVEKIADKGITSFSLDVIDRTSSRGQSMDILSSMATVSGYKAVITAAYHLPKFFPMFMTAAGTITPAKVLVIGAAVAGLQVIATARKLGAQVEAFDVRAAAKEEVLSLGGKFIEVEGAADSKAAGGYAVEQSDEYKQRQAEKVHEHAIKADVIICTAQIPGRKAPVILKKETVEAMKKGAVIVDIAASTGGNCELTKDNETIVHNGVTIIGNSFLPSTMPADASKMFGKNVVNFLKLIIDKEGNLNLNWDDNLVKGICVTHNKEIVNERVKNFIGV